MLLAEDDCMMLTMRLADNGDMTLMMMKKSDCKTWNVSYGVFDAFC